jgi:hypothetical protein
MCNAFTIDDFLLSWQGTNSRMHSTHNHMIAKKDHTVVAAIMRDFLA